MNLKFELKKNGSTDGILTVDVDESGNIKSLSCTNTSIEKAIKIAHNLDYLKRFVRCTVSGIMCSDQIEISFGSRLNVSYKIIQMA